MNMQISQSVKDACLVKDAYIMQQHNKTLDCLYDSIQWADVYYAGYQENEVELQSLAHQSKSKSLIFLHTTHNLIVCRENSQT